MLIIGLIGQKRVGKDTVADLFTELMNNRLLHRFALADPIKDIARIMFNFDENQLYDTDKDNLDENWGIKPRDFFEKFGTDIMQFDIYKYLPGLETKIPQREFWVQLLLKKIKKILISSENQPIVIITDIRGTHELLAIKKEFTNALFIKIIRPTNKQLDDKMHLTQIEPQTISDNLIDYNIINDKCIDSLREKVANIVSKL